MAGIYIHIPFCSKACYYCDFYKTVDKKKIPEFLVALKNEAKIRKIELENQTVSTIYFGGGTPSLLNANQIADILDSIFTNYNILHDGVEITLEANPDDLSLEYLKALKLTRVNRLSIGTQSFIDDELKLMNRRHTAREARSSVWNAYEIGFHNLTADLIYGLPNSTLQSWEYSLYQLFQLPVAHLSAYHLAYEKQTVFDNWVSRQKIQPIDEDLSYKQFKLLRKQAISHGFEHYEVSNFAKNGFRSRHNSSYWNRQQYLGFGPAAHSYSLHSRSWNKPDINSYVGSLANGELDNTIEILSATEQYHDYLITRLRTIEGVDFKFLKHNFEPLHVAYFQRRVSKFLATGKMVLEAGQYKIPPEHFFVSDGIIEDLFFVE